MSRCRHFSGMRRRVWCAVAVLLTVLAPASAAGAQVLAGTVRDSVARIPVPGVVVILLDSTGGTVARTLTNERGDFRVALGDAVRTLRFVRIGFTPREVPVPPRTDGTTRLDLAMFALPSLIGTVHISANSRCRVRKDRAHKLF